MKMEPLNLQIIITRKKINHKKKGVIQLAPFF